MKIRITVLIVIFALISFACGDEPEPTGNQSTNGTQENQSDNQADNQSANQTNNQSDNQTNNQSANQSDNQTNNQSANQTNNQTEEPFDATWSWELMIDSAQSGTLQFTEDYADATIAVACEIDDTGLRLQARVPSPVSGCEDEEDVLPLMVFNYDENGSFNRTAYPGPWSSLSTPIIHAFNGDSGECFTRPLFEQDYAVDFTTDGDGTTTADLVINGEFDDSFGGTYVNFESTFVFNADQCEAYDSGDPVCGGGETDCQALPANELCTDSGCSLGNACTYPTAEECAALDAAECQQNQQCEYVSPNDSCVLGTGFSFYPENCQHPQVTDQGQAFCESQGCVWRDTCTGGAIACQDVALEDDLICTQVYGCTW